MLNVDFKSFESFTVDYIGDNGEPATRQFENVVDARLFYYETDAADLWGYRSWDGHHIIASKDFTVGGIPC